MRENNVLETEILTTDELAEFLKLHRYRVCQLAREKVIPSFRLGRQLRFEAAAIREFIRTGGRDLPGGWRKKKGKG